MMPLVNPAQCRKGRKRTKKAKSIAHPFKPPVGVTRISIRLLVTW